MIYCVYVTNIMKDVSKVVDYLEVGSPHHVRSYFWWGGDRNRKNSQENYLYHYITLPGQWETADQSFVKSSTALLNCINLKNDNY